MTDRPCKVRRKTDARDAANASSQCDFSVATEPSATGATEPNTPGQQEKLSLRIEGSLTGDVLLNITEEQLTWSKEKRKLRASDIFDILRIDKNEHSLFDLFDSEQPEEPAQDLQFGHVYILMKRVCARCNACGACCTRTDTHSLCSHGNVAHLWCRPRQVSGDDKIRSRSLVTTSLETARVETRLCIVTVEGYANGNGLSTRFSDDEISNELSNIARQYDITIPDDFNRH